MGSAHHLTLLGLLVTAAGLVAWWFAFTRWCDRGRAAPDPDRAVMFHCRSVTGLRRLRRIPQCKAGAENMRWLVLNPYDTHAGRLVMDEKGVVWIPGLVSRHVYRAPAVVLPWQDIARAQVDSQLGPRDAGALLLTLVNKKWIHFSVVRQGELDALLRRLDPIAPPRPTRKRRWWGLS